MAKIPGTIVAPRGDIGVDELWQSIFVPEGSDMTVAEMSDNEEAFHPRNGAIRDLEVRRDCKKRFQPP